MGSLEFAVRHDASLQPSHEKQANFRCQHSQHKTFPWGCTNQYYGQWKHFEFEKNFDFQTIHIRDHLLAEGFLKDSKAKLRLKDVNGYLMEKLKLEEKPCKRKADVVSTWETHFPRLNLQEWASSVSSSIFSSIKCVKLCMKVTLTTYFLA